MTIAAVILCGGESRRMGRPKAWLPFAGELMLQRVVRLISTVADPLVVVAAPEQLLPPLPTSVAVARDPVRGRGPLQGLAAGLRSLPGQVDLCYASGTDVPFFRPEWVGLLAAAIGDDDLAIPACGGRHHPLAALYRRSVALPAIDALLLEDRLRPVFLMERLRTREVSEAELRAVDPELLTLCNMNTPDDYRSALEHIGPVEEAEARRSADPVAATRPAVVVELFGVPRLRAGVGRLRVEAGSVGEALRCLGLACPALVGPVLTPEGTLRPAYMLSLNGRNFVSDPGTPLAEGDALLLLAVDAGG